MPPPAISPCLRRRSCCSAGRSVGASLASIHASRAAMLRSGSRKPRLLIPSHARPIALIIVNRHAARLHPERCLPDRRGLRTQGRHKVADTGAGALALQRRALLLRRALGARRGAWRIAGLAVDDGDAPDGDRLAATRGAPWRHPRRRHRHADARPFTAALSAAMAGASLFRPWSSAPRFLRTTTAKPQSARSLKLAPTYSSFAAQSKNYYPYKIAV